MIRAFCLVASSALAWEDVPQTRTPKFRERLCRGVRKGAGLLRARPNLGQGHGSLIGSGSGRLRRSLVRISKLLKPAASAGTGMPTEVTEAAQVARSAFRRVPAGFERPCGGSRAPCRAGLGGLAGQKRACAGARSDATSPCQIQERTGCLGKASASDPKAPVLSVHLPAPSC